MQFAMFGCIFFLKDFNFLLIFFGKLLIKNNQVATIMPQSGTQPAESKSGNEKSYCPSPLVCEVKIKDSNSEG